GRVAGVGAPAPALTGGGRGAGLLGIMPRPAAVEHEPPVAAERLTPRQLEVLQLLARGTTTDEIAAELHVSRETVRNHVRHLLERLGATSRLEAVAPARPEGPGVGEAPPRGPSESGFASGRGAGQPGGVSRTEQSPRRTRAQD